MIAGVVMMVLVRYVMRMRVIVVFQTPLLAGFQQFGFEHASNRRVFLFFFDPQCMHCFDAAKRMSQYHWGDTRVVGIPISQPQWAPQFSRDTGLRMDISPDLEKLKQIFPYTSVPAGVALENGREKAALVKFEGDEPEASLKNVGLVN